MKKMYLLIRIQCHINDPILDYPSFLGYDIFMNVIESQHSRSHWYAAEKAEYNMKKSRFFI